MQYLNILEMTYETATKNSTSTTMGNDGNAKTRVETRFENSSFPEKNALSQPHQHRKILM